MWFPMNDPGPKDIRIFDSSDHCGAIGLPRSHHVTVPVLA